MEVLTGSVEYNRPGIGLSLPIRLGNQGYFAQTYTVLEQIKSNVTNLLLTSRGERVMQPQLGSNLRYILFDNITETTKAEIEDTILTAIQN